MLKDMGIDSFDSIYNTSEDEDTVGSTLSKSQDKIIKHYVKTNNADLKRYLNINHRVEYKLKSKLRKSKSQNNKAVIYCM
jgi:hypothetical protein